MAQGPKVNPRRNAKQLMGDISCDTLTTVIENVLLDDRGQIEVGNNVSISDYVNIYSHTHDIYDIETVYNRATRIGHGVRITYHATLLAGVEIGDYAMIGSGAVVTANIEPYHIALGVPAKTAKVKSPKDVRASTGSD